MLILTRKAGETIVIGDSIRVTVQSIRGRNVRLRIAAPSGIPIFREEVYRSIEEENVAAARSHRELPKSLGSIAINLEGGPQHKK